MNDSTRRETDATGDRSREIDGRSSSPSRSISRLGGLAKKTVESVESVSVVSSSSRLVVVSSRNDGKG